MRIEQRKMFEEFGWESLDSANIASEKKPATPRKRAAKNKIEDEDGEDGEKVAKKAKKGGKKGAKKGGKKGAKKEESEEEDFGGIGGGIKEEVVDEET
jgi:hypothetical protein